MNTHILLAIALILFFIFCGCGAKEMFSFPAPQESPVEEGPVQVQAPVARESPAEKEPVQIQAPVAISQSEMTLGEIGQQIIPDAASSLDMIAPTDIPAPEEMLKAQPTAPMPAQGGEMGYYNFAKVMYM